MNVITFEPAHAQAIALQKSQADMPSEGIPEGGVGFTGIEGDRIIFCCGKCPLPDAEGWFLWALLSEEAGKYMTRIARLGKRMIKMDKHPVGALIRCDFEEGHRLVRMLGMKPTGLTLDLDGIRTEVYLCNT